MASALCFTRTAFPAAQAGAEYNVLRFGAAGDGTALDGAAIQRAIDTAADRGGGRVVLPGGKTFLLGAIVLRSGVELHLADDVLLLASTNPDDYTLKGYGTQAGLLNADGARGAQLSGTGNIDGQAMKFMTTYSETDERWGPRQFRPRMFSLKRCMDLEVTGISMARRTSRFWTCCSKISI